MLVMRFGILIDLSLSQPSNAWLPILQRLSGKTMVSKLLQPEKAKLPILVMLSDNSTDERLIQPLKTLSPMVVTGKFITL